jgi:hypothetical protein
LLPAMQQQQLGMDVRMADHPINVLLQLAASQLVTTTGEASRLTSSGRFNRTLAQALQERAAATVGPSLGAGAAVLAASTGAVAAAAGNVILHD